MSLASCGVIGRAASPKTKGARRLAEQRTLRQEQTLPSKRIGCYLILAAANAAAPARVELPSSSRWHTWRRTESFSTCARSFSSAGASDEESMERNEIQEAWKCVHFTQGERRVGARMKL
eukprot:280086-Rhodomonas_salina.1